MTYDMKQLLMACTLNFILEKFRLLFRYYFIYVNMDDYSVSSLQESRNDWYARLINIIKSLVIEGIRSIFNESWKLCQK